MCQNDIQRDYKFYDALKGCKNRTICQNDQIFHMNNGNIFEKENS